MMAIYAPVLLATQVQIVTLILITAILIHVKIMEHACQMEITMLAFVQMTSMESTVI